MPNIDRWANPPSWPEWSALLLVEMERHDWPLGKDIDPEDWREFFEEGYGPHAALEEDFSEN